MSSKKFLFLATIIILFLLQSSTEAAGVLTFFSNDGSKLFHPTLFNKTENILDLSHPISLLEENRNTEAPYPTLIFSSDSEDVYSLEKNDTLITDISARGKKVFFLLPQRTGKNLSIFGFDQYSSKINLYNNHDGEITQLNFRSSGNMVSYARRKGKFHAGFYQNFSSIKGSGIVPDLNAKTNLLSPDSETTINMKEKKYGWAVGYKFGKKYLLSYQQNTVVLPLNITIHDTDDVFYFPVESKGTSRETTLSFPFSNRDDFLAFYQKGENTALNITRFHISQPADMAEFANSLRFADYKSYGLGWMRRITKRSILHFEMEKYYGEFSGAGDISPGVSAFIPHYFYEHRGDFHLAIYKTHYLRKMKKFSFSTSYSMMPFDANLYFFMCQKLFLGGCQSPPLFEENYIFKSSKIHSLSIGIKAELGHGKNLVYSVTQIVPQINRVQAAVPAPPGPPAPPERKKEKGGRIHLLMLEFRF